jgi:hypothetical protein
VGRPFRALVEVVAKDMTPQMYQVIAWLQQEKEDEEQHTLAKDRGKIIRESKYIPNLVRT